MGNGKEKKKKVAHNETVKISPQCKDLPSCFKNNHKKHFLQTHAFKDPDIQQEPCAYMPASFYAVLSVGWFSTDSPSVVD